MPLKKVGTAGFEPATSALSRQRSKPTELSPDKSYCDVVKQKNILQEECFLVGAAGFEPATPWSQTRCANRTAPRPDNKVFYCGESGIRTRGTSLKVRQFSKLVVSATHPSHQVFLWIIC